MNKASVRKWSSKEGLEECVITIWQVEDTKVVELDYTTPLDSIREEYNKTRARKRKLELEQEYKRVSEILNAPYKNNLYNKEL